MSTFLTSSTSTKTSTIVTAIHSLHLMQTLLKHKHKNIACILILHLPSKETSNKSYFLFLILWSWDKCYWIVSSSVDPVTVHCFPLDREYKIILVMSSGEVYQQQQPVTTTLHCWEAEINKYYSQQHWQCICWLLISQYHCCCSCQSPACSECSPVRNKV